VQDIKNKNKKKKKNQKKLLTTFPFCITICNMVATIPIIPTVPNQGKNEVITTARLPNDTRNKLLILSKAKNKTKSQIIKEALEMYYEKEEGELDSYTLGMPFFGKYGSGIGNLSTTYKERFREYLVARQNSY